MRMSSQVPLGCRTSRLSCCLGCFDRDPLRLRNKLYFNSRPTRRCFKKRLMTEDLIQVLLQ